MPLIQLTDREIAILVLTLNIAGDEVTSCAGKVLGAVVSEKEYAALGSKIASNHPENRHDVPHTR